MNGKLRQAAHAGNSQQPLFSLSPDWIWLLLDADPRLRSVRLRSRKGSATVKPCPEMKVFSTMHNVHENNMGIVKSQCQ